MKEKSLATLEFPKVLERLAAHAETSAGRELCLALRPTVDYAEAVRKQKEAAEARYLIESSRRLPIASVRDVRAAVNHAALGGILDPQALLDTQATAAAARSVRDTILRLESLLPTLAPTARRLVEMRELEAEIGRCIDARGQLTDAASPALRALRRGIKIAHDRLMARLDELVRSSGYRQALQEPLITQRSSRYVVPVKIEARGQVQGIVHDVSASGATLFVEPLVVVELQNQWRELQAEVEREVERILRQLSAMVGDGAEAMVENVAALAELDLALARGRYGLALRATEPEFVPWGKNEASPGLQLTDARHPLLPESVVPITMVVGGDYSALLITGPNTGGKTVALKTTGLLCLMAQSGIPIPAAEGSRLPVYDGVYADIGDEQSIEQSLSTFGSHMGNIIAILRQATPWSLVLLDELAAGTEPGEGAALARAILEDILSRRIPTVATTHHGELKVFAHTTPGIRNASVEFDPVTLAPTYRLTIGLPGRSNAFAIAARLGLASDIVTRAQHYLPPTAVELERLLSEIQHERDLAEAVRRALEEQLRAARELRQRLEERLANIETERLEVVEAAWREALAELEGVRDRLRRATSALEALPAPEPLAVAAAEVEAARRQLRQLRPKPVALPHAIVPGATIRLRSLNLMGEVISGPDASGEVEIRLGLLRARVQAHELAPGATTASDSQTIERASFPYPAVPVALELHLRGLRVDEATEALDRYLDSAFRDGLTQVRVVHGKGTGQLRSAVREFLARHPLVESYRPGTAGEGSEGVTVVHLASRG